MFSTLLEFAILIFIQKQAFDRKIKKMVDSLCRENCYRDLQADTVEAGGALEAVTSDLSK